MTEDGTRTSTGRQGEGWRFASRPAWARPALVAAGLLLVVAAVAVWSVSSGLALLLGAVGLSVAILAWLEAERHRTSPRTVRRDGSVGLLVPLRTLPLWAAAVLALMAAAFVSHGAVQGVHGVTDGDWWQALLGVPSVAIGVVVASIPLAALRHRSRAPQAGLLLTPDALHLPGPGAAVVGWEEVTGTHASWVTVPAQGAGGSTRDLLRLSLTPEAVLAHLRNPYVADTDALYLSVDALACDPHAVRALLDHYLVTPADRGELGTEAALRRFAALAGGRGQRTRWRPV